MCRNGIALPPSCLDCVVSIRCIDAGCCSGRRQKRNCHAAGFHHCGLAIKGMSWIAAANEWAITAWSLGVLIFSLRLAWGAGQLSAMRRHGKPADAPLLRIVEGLSRKIGAGPVKLLRFLRNRCPECHWMDTSDHPASGGDDCRAHAYNNSKLFSRMSSPIFAAAIIL